MAHSAPTQRKISLCPCVGSHNVGIPDGVLHGPYWASVRWGWGNAWPLCALVGRRVRPSAAPTHDAVTCRLDEPTWRERANRHDAGHVARAVGAVATRLFCGKHPWRIHQMRPLCLLESAFWSQTDTNGRVDRVGRSERDVGKWCDCASRLHQTARWIHPATDGSPTPRLLTLLLHEMLCHHHHKPHPPEHEHSRLEAACWGEQMAPRPPASGPSTDSTHGGLQLSAPPGAARGPARPEATGGGLVVRGGQEEKHAGAPGPGPGFAMPVLHTAHVAALTHTHTHTHTHRRAPAH